MKRLLTAAVLCTVLILGSVWSIKAVDNTAQAVALDVENDRLNEARETWDAAQTLRGRHGTQHRPCSALCCCTARLIRLTGCLTVCLPHSKTA